NWTTFSESSFELVSCLIAEALPLVFAISSATRCAASRLMSVMTTFAPLEARSLEIASPRPEPPPVTSATLFVKSAMVMTFFLENLWGHADVVLTSRNDEMAENIPLSAGLLGHRDH